MIADGLYEKLINDLLQDCLRKKKAKTREHIKKDKTTSSVTTSSTVDTNTKLNETCGIDSSEKIGRKKFLSNQQIETTAQQLLPYYCEGARDKIAFAFSGLAYKEGIAEESVSKILEKMCIRTNDTAKISRLETLHRTYVNGQESGFGGITGVTKLKEVIAFVSSDNEAENVVQNILQNWQENRSSASSSKDNNKNDDHKQSQLLNESLAKKLAVENIDNPAEYVISIINKMVKCDDGLVRATLYAGLSTYSLDPINLVIAAPTSEGKTYTALQTLEYFPTKDVKKYGSMSPKVIIRENGVLVDSRTLKPVMEDIKILLRQIEREKKDEHKRNLESQLEDLKSNACMLIDLQKKIYVFLEPPHPDLWTILKPIMSHDSYLIEHPYVDTPEGIHAKNILTLGFPTFIFCTAKDESKWEQWDEIVSRRERTGFCYCYTGTIDFCTKYSYNHFARYCHINCK
jgi:hypothetical protein